VQTKRSCKLFPFSLQAGEPVGLTTATGKLGVSAATNFGETRYRPRARGRRDDMPPADGSSTVAYRFAAKQAIMDPKIAADLRLSADGSAVRTSLVAGSG